MKLENYKSPDINVISVQVEGVIFSASTSNEGYELGNIYEGIFEDE